MPIYIFQCAVSLSNKWCLFFSVECLSFSLLDYNILSSIYIHPSSAFFTINFSNKNKGNLNIRKKREEEKMKYFRQGGQFRFQTPLVYYKWSLCWIWNSLFIWLVILCHPWLYILWHLNLQACSGLKHWGWEDF